MSKFYIKPILVLLLVLVLGLLSSKIYNIGYTSGEQTASEYYKSELLKQAELYKKQMAELVSTNQKIQNEKAKLDNKIRSFVKRDNDLARLRQQNQLKFEQSISEATTKDLRRYAEACDRNTTGFRENIKRFGLEAAECSRTAEIQRRDLDNWQNAITGVPSE